MSKKFKQYCALLYQMNILENVLSGILVGICWAYLLNLLWMPTNRSFFGSKSYEK